MGSRLRERGSEAVRILVALVASVRLQDLAAGLADGAQLVAHAAVGTVGFGCVGTFGEK